MLRLHDTDGDAMRAQGIEENHRTLPTALQVPGLSLLSYLALREVGVGGLGAPADQLYSVAFVFAGLILAMANLVGQSGIDQPGADFLRAEVLPLAAAFGGTGLLFTCAEQPHPVTSAMPVLGVVYVVAVCLAVAGKESVRRRAREMSARAWTEQLALRCADAAERFVTDHRQGVREAAHAVVLCASAVVANVLAWQILGDLRMELTDLLDVPVALMVSAALLAMGAVARQCYLAIPGRGRVVPVLLVAAVLVRGVVLTFESARTATAACFVLTFWVAAILPPARVLHRWATAATPLSSRSPRDRQGGRHNRSGEACAGQLLAWADAKYFGRLVRQQREAAGDDHELGSG